MSQLVMIEGRIVPPAEAVISVFDRGFLYGDSVFETIRTYDGKPFALIEHIERLKSSASLVLIEMPASTDQIAEEVRQAVAAAGNAESYIRVMVTRGTGELGLDPGLAKNPLRVIIVAPLVSPPEEDYQHGIGCVTYETQRVAESTSAVGAKVGNYLVSALAMREARAAHAQEALITDGRGTVVEGATSNVFAVLGGKLVTPPVEAGILLGITRRHILEIAEELGITIELRAPGVEELYGADEVFISSSIREILPVVRVNGRPVGQGRPGAVARQLLLAFRKKVRILQ
jgi:branched-chain amino acid aminotransferase